MRNRFCRSSMHVITILMVVCFIASNLAVVRAQTNFDETRRIVGFWQRIGYPSIAQDAVKRIIQSDNAALESYIKFHSQRQEGIRKIRAKTEALVDSRSTGIGYQAGLQEYQPVLLYQTHRDTIILVNIQFDVLTYPKYAKHLEHNQDTLIELNIGRYCKHYLTADGGIVRRDDHRECPLNSQDEDVEWRTDKDNGMIVPIDNVIQREGGYGSSYYKRNYLTRILPAHTIQQLVVQLDRLNTNIDSAFVYASDMFDQILFKYGSFNRGEGECGLPVMVKILGEGKQNVVIDTIYTRGAFASLVFKNNELNLDGETSPGQNYQRHWIHKRIDLEGYGPGAKIGSGNYIQHVECVNPWGNPRSVIQFLDIGLLGKRLLSLNKLHRVTDNSFRLAGILNGAVNIDSLVKVVNDEIWKVRLYDSLASMIKEAYAVVANEYQGARGESLLKAQLLAKSIENVDTTAYFDVSHPCTMLRNKADDVIRSVAYLISISNKVLPSRIELGEYKKLDDTIDYQRQVHSDSLVFRQVEEATRNVDKVLQEFEAKVYKNLISVKGMKTEVMAAYHSQISSPTAAYRLLTIRGNCSDNHVLNLFAMTVRENPELLKADEDDIVEVMMAQPYSYYRRIKSINFVATEDEIDDYDDSVEVYQELYDDGDLIDRVVDMPRETFNTYSVDYLTLGNILSEHLRTYLDSLNVLRARHDRILQTNLRRLAMARRFVELKRNTVQDCPSVFSIQHPSNELVLGSNYLGSKVGDIESAAQSYLVSRGFDNKYGPISRGALSDAVNNIPTMSSNVGGGLMVSFSDSKPQFHVYFKVNARAGSGRSWSSDYGCDWLSCDTYINSRQHRAVVIRGEEPWLSDEAGLSDDRGTAPTGTLSQHSILLIGNPSASAAGSLIDVQGLYYMGNAANK